ncbi:hypothetical protein SS50377_27560 [Spironucleus salmonicida]|uniref:Dynein regulatory complex protein 12 n=1 Tax=Spironucleus salmonicida TaxID=348837 RepID=V6LPS0_9EUKA|nr:hypothetical protein SS50377_27560 [Spironucleus salmonicida]|eukprot:EST46662.1 hypothetical protein SS50377_13467 [Spironucleus salmonicida]
MPPKAGAGNKDEDPFKEKYLQAEQRIQVLERQLLARAEENARLAAEVRNIEQQAKKFSQEVQIERADRSDITSDMTRQFKAMQDELLKDISERERSIEAIRASAAKERIQLESDMKEKNEIIQRKDQEILELKTRLDQLSREFSSILRETLDTISDKIEHKTDEVNIM